MSEEDKGERTLQNLTNDYVAAAARAALGTVPFAGSLLAELAGVVIPNQRVDRLVKFAVALEARLTLLDQQVLRAKLTDENFTDLMEETMHQAARAVTSERRRYLAALLANSVTTRAISYIE